MFVIIVVLFIVAVVVVFSCILTYFLLFFVRNYVQVDVLVGAHPWRPSGSQLGWEKGATEVFKHGQKIPSGLNLFKAQLITMFV